MAYWKSRSHHVKNTIHSSTNTRLVVDRLGRQRGVSLGCNAKVTAPTLTQAPCPFSPAMFRRSSTGGGRTGSGNRWRSSSAFSSMRSRWALTVGTDERAHRISKRHYDEKGGSELEQLPKRIELLFFQFIRTLCAHRGVAFSASPGGSETKLGF